MALPKYIKPSMTIENAARQAAMRNCHLKVFWDPVMGFRVIEVKREPEKG